MSSLNSRSSNKGTAEDAGSSDQDLESWLLPFADMITFLMAFFVIVYTTATTDLKNAEKIREAVAQSMQMEATKPPPKELKYRRAVNSIKKAVKKEGMGRHLSFERNFDEIKVTASGEVWFKSASDILNSQAEAILKTLAIPIIEQNFHVRIEGHTDDIPISTKRFPSNWELSSARTISVLKFLQSQGVNQQNFSIAGYADTQPLVLVPDWGTQKQQKMARTKNRRVVIFLKFKQKKRKR